MLTATSVPDKEAPPPRLFTRREYHAMAEAGILGPEDRVELIHGRIVNMMPPGPWHGAATDRLANALHQIYAHSVIIACGRPLGLGEDSEPQPDLSILRWRDDFYASAHPGPQDVLLAIEISDSSRTFDLGTKHDLYALHGVPEYWVIDRLKNGVQVFREPANGAYHVHRVYQPGEAIPLPGLNNATLAVTDTGLGVP
jgi:hypothetical protein